MSDPTIADRKPTPTNRGLLTSRWNRQYYSRHERDYRGPHGQASPGQEAPA